MSKKEELGRLKSEMEKTSLPLKKGATNLVFGGGKFTRSKLKYSVNEDFFNKWSREMAYVLGFTYADGNVYKTSLTWEVQIRDDDILKKIKKASKATYPIQNRSNSWRLRISNQILINGAIKKGLFPKKNMRNAFPKIPKNFIKHFIRGYLDGDGWIVVRKNRNEVDIGFASGRREFLDILNNTISKILDIVPSKVRTKIKITPRGITATTHQLEFYSSNAIKIARWLYGGLNKKDLYLDRKYNKYIEANKLYDFLESGTRKVRIIQEMFGRNIKEILDEFYNGESLDGVSIAKILGVHSSSVYRWLARTGIKYPEKRKDKSLWTMLQN